MDDKILFFGCFYPECEYESIYRNTTGGLQNASNILQWDYIHGLERNLGGPILTATRMSLGIYPVHYNKPYLKTHRFERDGGAFGIAVGFWNTLPVRPFFFNRVGTGHVKNWAEECGGKGTLFAYSYAMAPIITAVKRKYPGIKTVLILPDLPRYTFMDHKNSPLYKFRRRMDESALKKALGYTDLLVTITKRMGEVLDPEDRVRKIVVDGMIRDRDLPPVKDTKDDSAFTVAYTGTLTKDYGIPELLAAMEELKDNAVRLIVCGKGEAEPELKALAAKDPRVIYRGQVPPEEARRVQLNADLLINPRKDDRDYTRYSFPSKILQYMSTGTPVLCYKLSGFDPEYDGHLFYIGDDESLSDALKRIMAMPRDERTAMGRKAAQFVTCEKNMVAQTKRVLEQIP